MYHIYFKKQDIVGELFWKKEVHIDCSGIKNSLRNSRDGVSYFGPVEKANNIIINDFIINYKKDTNSKRLFVIFFERSKLLLILDLKKYFLKCINNSKSDNSLFYLKIES